MINALFLLILDTWNRGRTGDICRDRPPSNTGSDQLF
jgi:hypothetical protein